MNFAIAIGYFAAILNVLGNLMLSKKSRAGWMVRLATNGAFLAYAVAVEGGIGPLGFNHILFAAINVYGWIEWSRSET